MLTSDLVTLHAIQFQDHVRGCIKANDSPLSDIDVSGSLHRECVLSTDSMRLRRSTMHLSGDIGLKMNSQILGQRAFARPSCMQQVGR